MNSNVTKLLIEQYFSLNTEKKNSFYEIKAKVIYEGFFGLGEKIENVSMF